MINVAFFLNTKHLGKMDCRNPLLGNPGIGGTEYEFILVSSELAKLSSEGNVFFITDGAALLPESLDVLQTDGTHDDVLRLMHENDCSVLVLDAKLDYAFILALSTSSVRLVIWEHLLPNYKKIKALNSIPNLAALVCVGREQLDLFRDHNLYRKSTYIYNACPLPPGVLEQSVANCFEERAPVVTFMGSLTPNKGFHLLADAWTTVVKRNPYAQLHVIGSGGLYSKDAKLGPLGLAEEGYEKRITDALKDTDGNLMQSVHFHGVLGDEKWDVLCQTKVGVPNPSGVSETFGICAVEMMMGGALVVTKRCPGFLDSVFETGLLYRDVRDLAEGILQKLDQTENRYEDCLEFINTHFGVKSVVEKWEQLFYLISNGEELLHGTKLVHPNFRLKWFREINRHLRKLFPFLLPVLRLEELMKTLKGRLK